MPVIKLGGRLGNQLFQVAFGIAQAARSKTPLLIESSALSEVQRQQLQTWTGPLTLASPELVKALVGDDAIVGKLHRVWQRMKPSSLKTWVLQSTAAFDSRCQAPKKMAFFDGYWQSYRYFEAQESLVRSEIRFRAALSPQQADLVQRLIRPNTVSLHVRRGDYVVSGGLGSLPLTYYQEAVRHLSRVRDVGELFVFSDDALWCRDNLDLGSPFFVVEGQPPEVDLFLMSKTDHHIIANSTFSWWGAWLAVGAGTVVAPRSWFPSYDENPPLSDIYPPRWNLL